MKIFHFTITIIVTYIRISTNHIIYSYCFHCVQYCDDKGKEGPGWPDKIKDETGKKKKIKDFKDFRGIDAKKVHRCLLVLLKAAFTVSPIHECMHRHLASQSPVFNQLCVSCCSHAMCAYVRRRVVLVVVV